MTVDNAYTTGCSPAQAPGAISVPEVVSGGINGQIVDRTGVKPSSFQHPPDD